MEQMRLIHGFRHYRTDLGDGVRTGIYFGHCTGSCSSVCTAQNFLKENDFSDDTMEKKLYTAKELLEYLREEKILFPTKPLGISFLGPEPLRDLAFCEEVAYGIKKLGMSLHIHTCGLCPFFHYRAVSDFCDLFYFRMFSPIPGIAPPLKEYSFDRVWENLSEFERKKLPYRLVIPVIKGLNTHTAEAFAALSPALRSLKSIVIDFSQSGLNKVEQEAFRNFFYRKNIVLY